MAKLSAFIYVAVEVDRCPRCLAVGTIQILGALEGSTRKGVCACCETIVHVAEVSVESEAGDG